MKASEYREMSRQQLVLTLKELQDGLFRLRFQAQTEKLEAPSEIRKSKREIARVKTLLREMELAGSSSDTASAASEATEE